MRNLASIQQVVNIEPIEGADAIEKATVLGWGVVIKKGQFQVGDKCVYFEIDALLPNRPCFDFLKTSSWTEQKKKIRLKTVRLRGTLSQGLLMPLEEFPEITSNEVGTDLTELLGIEKYEPEIPAQLSGEVNSFQFPITKTDEERIENSPNKFIESIRGKPYYITIKLDGTSSSFILKEDGDFHVCSRNYSLRENETNSYWRIEKKYDIKNKLLSYKEKTGKSISIQGEIVGPGIQQNKLGLKEIDLFVFNVVDTATNKRFSFEEAVHFCKENGLRFVPVLEYGGTFLYNSMKELQELSQGKYIEFFSDAKPSQDREGIVIRSKDQEVSFKVINNQFLLKEKD